MKQARTDDQFSEDEAEIARRRDSALLRALSTPHKRQKEMKLVSATKRRRKIPLPILDSFTRQKGRIWIHSLGRHGEIRTRNLRISNPTLSRLLRAPLSYVTDKQTARAVRIA
jgi:hypothetical protein